MEGLLGDGDGDVSRRDVPPRDVPLCRVALAGSSAARAALTGTERESNW